MTDSRRKGASGERDFARAVEDAVGVRLVRRLDQCRGGGHDLGVDTGAAAAVLRTFAPEVKRHRATPPGDVAAWWRQAVQQADAAGLVPLLAYRADRVPWRLVLPLATLVPDALHDDAAPAAPPTVTLALDGFADLVRARS